MYFTVGIDIGSSATKAVACLRNGEVAASLWLKNKLDFFEAYREIKADFSKKGFPLEEAQRIVYTGAGSSRLPREIEGKTVLCCKEMDAVANGGLVVSGETKVLIANIGTGTSFVRAEKGKKAVHLGGSGVGGGMFLGLCSRFLGENDVEKLMKMAEKGDLSEVDLQIRDISTTSISFLQEDITAANLAKMKESAKKEDMVLGIINMIFQTVGTMAVFASFGSGEKTAVITGTLATLPQASLLLEQVGCLYDFKFVIPEQAAFATAVGAALWDSEEK